MVFLQLDLKFYQDAEYKYVIQEMTMNGLKNIFVYIYIQIYVTGVLTKKSTY